MTGKQKSAMDIHKDAKGNMNSCLTLRCLANNWSVGAYM